MPCNVGLSHFLFICHQRSVSLIQLLFGENAFRKRLWRKTCLRPKDKVRLDSWDLHGRMLYSFFICDVWECVCVQVCIVLIYRVGVKFSQKILGFYEAAACISPFLRRQIGLQEDDCPIKQWLFMEVKVTEDGDHPSFTACMLKQVADRQTGSLWVLLSPRTFCPVISFSCVVFHPSLPLPSRHSSIHACIYATDYSGDFGNPEDQGTHARTHMHRAIWM